MTKKEKSPSELSSGGLELMAKKCYDYSSPVSKWLKFRDIFSAMGPEQLIALAISSKAPAA
jgi:hypothetical protein